MGTASSKMTEVGSTAAATRGCFWWPLADGRDAACPRAPTQQQTACTRSLLQKCQLPRQGALCTSIRPENELLRPLEAIFLSFRGLPTANSVDLASHRTFATDS